MRAVPLARGSRRARGSGIGLDCGCGHRSLWAVLYDTVEMLRIMCRDNMALCGGCPGGGEMRNAHDT